MKIDFKKPKYILPLIVFPFLPLLFYCYKSFSKEKQKTVEVKPALKTDIADVSDKIKKTDINNKLDAFKNQYKHGDGYTAVSDLGEEQVQGQSLQGQYNEKEKQSLDSIDALFKAKYGNPASDNNIRGHYSTNISDRNPIPGRLSTYQNSGAKGISKEDRDLAAALSNLKGKSSLNPRQENRPGAKEKYDDPMALFREQMKVIDSIGKNNDPSFKSQKQKEDLLNKEDNIASKFPKLDVVKATDVNDDFNTVQVSKPNDFIKAIIDQNITGYSGSRVRIRLLEDIKAGKYLIKKGTYIYALISGFSEQRVKLTVMSVMTDDKILPVKLEIFDLDGMPGLYVPASAFRAFTKDVSNIGSSIQLQQDPSTANQLYMSALSKLFTSTSSAVTKLIRQNKAKLKYSTYLYLIDPDELKQKQQSY